MAAPLLLLLKLWSDLSFMSVCCFGWRATRSGRGRMGRLRQQQRAARRAPVQMLEATRHTPRRRSTSGSQNAWLAIRQKPRSQHEKTDQRDRSLQTDPRPVELDEAEGLAVVLVACSREHVQAPEGQRRSRHFRQLAGCRGRNRGNLTLLLLLVGHGALTLK